MIKIISLDEIGPGTWGHLEEVYHAVPDARVFSDPAFLRQCATFWQSRGYTVLCVLGVADDQEYGLLCLRETKLQFRGSSMSVLVSVTYPLADVNPILCIPEDKPIFLSQATEALLKRKKKVFLNHLQKTDSRIVENIKPWVPSGSIANPYFVGEISRLLNKKSVKQSEKALLRLNDANVTHYRGAATAPWLDTLFDLHTRRWAASGIQSGFCDEEIRLFYEKVVNAPFGPNRGAIISVLRAEGNVVALHLGFFDERTTIYHTPCFSVPYMQMAPGVVLLNAVLQNAVKDGFTEFDLGNGEEAYKSRYANEVRCYKNYFLLPKRVDRWTFFARGVLSSQKVFQFVRKAFLRFQREGMIGSVVRAIKAVRYRSYERLLWFSLSDCFVLGGREIGFKEYIPLWEDAIEKPPYLPIPTAYKRFRDGWRMFAVQSPVGDSFGWVVNKNRFVLDELGVAIETDKGSVLVVDCWTAPSARGLGLYPSLIRFICSQVPENKCIYVAASNLSSIRGIVKAGGKRLGSVFRVFGFCFQSMHLKRTGMVRLVE